MSARSIDEDDSSGNELRVKAPEVEGVSEVVHADVEPEPRV